MQLVVSLKSPVSETKMDNSHTQGIIQRTNKNRASIDLFYILIYSPCIHKVAQRTGEI